MPCRWKCGLLVVVVFSALLSGCWDRRELEERVNIMAIGIDNVPGKKELYKMTVQIPIPIKIAGSGGQGGGSSESAVQVMSVTGRSMGDAIKNLQQRLNQRIFLGHTRVLAISEEVAKEGIFGILDGFRRDPQMRRLLWPIVVKGEASALLHIKPKLVQVPVVYLMDLIQTGSKTGLIPDQTLGNFYIQTSNKALQPFLNYVAVGKNEVLWKGLAVFQKFKMLGHLDDIESWVLIQLRENKRGGDVVVPIPDKVDEFVTFRPHFVQTKLEIPHELGEHRAIFRCEVQGDIIETTSDPGFSKDQYISDMQKLIKSEMEKRASNMLQRLQKDFRSDILELGMSLRAHHYRDYWQKHDWEKDFPDFPIRIVYDIKIRRLGMEMK